MQELASPIKAAVGGSPDVAEALGRLRRAGYESDLTLRLEIGLRRSDGAEEAELEARLELTEDDRRTLRSMRIRYDDAD